MRSVFGGANIPTLEKYGNETSAACCGDMVLGKILRDYQIPLNEGEFGTMSFRPEPPWKTGFDEVIWCKPIFTFHHIHGKERVIFDEMERRYEDSGVCIAQPQVLNSQFQALAYNPQRPTLFKDIFTELIHPHLQEPMRADWDNFASRWVINSSTTLGELPAEMSPSAFMNATQTPETCQNACVALTNCMSWRHQKGKENLCALDVVVRLGRETDPAPAWEETVVVTSGWMMERIQVMTEDKCEIEHIF